MSGPSKEPMSPETLSQLMDGEWAELDRSRCVEGICSAPELRATWARWHLARDAIKGDARLNGDCVDLSLCDRIRGAIDVEPGYSNVVGLAPGAVTASARPAPQAPVVERSGGFRQLAMGFGLAASAAVVTLVGLSVWQDGGSDAPTQLAGDASTQDATPGTSVLASGRLPRVDLVGNAGASYWVSEQGDGVARSGAEERLNRFLSEHLESAPSTSREGLLPYSRLVGYDVAVGAR